MSARAGLAALLLLAACAPAAGAGTVPRPGPSLGFARVTGAGAPDLLLAQRTITREWGPSDDSVYVIVDIPDLKSEPLATTLSAVVPGAGHYYLGEGSAWFYLAVEAAGWGGWWWYRRSARDLREDAATLAGPPAEPASGWSFERWSVAAQQDAAGLMELHARDREAFYNAIATDPALVAGWADPAARTEFGALRLRADSRLSRARLYATGLWLNHLVSAVDALRSARFHNLPLTRTIGMRVRGGVRGGMPAVAVALERPF